MRYCSYSEESPKFWRCRKSAIDGGTRCIDHQVVRPPRLGELPDSVKNQVRAMYGHVCAVCGGVANEVDHIEPLSSFTFEERHKANLLSNLQLLCRKHHNEKTRQEARDRHGSDGYDPLQDMHNYHKSNRSRKKARQRANSIWYK